MPFSSTERVLKGLMAFVCLFVSVSVSLAQDRDIARALEQTTLWPQGVLEWYEQRGHTFSWIGAAGPTSDADAVVALPRGAWEDGLDPTDYQAEKWAGLIVSARQGRLTRSKLAELDVGLTAALFTFLHHLRDGRVAPNRVHEGWNPFPRDERRVAEAIQRAVSTRTLTRIRASFRPPYPGYERLRGALHHYKAMARSGGWPALNIEGTLRAGDEGAAVLELRRRLAFFDSTLVASRDSATFDAPLEAAVRQMQAGFGLEPDGVVGRQTLAALNVPVDLRMEQIRLSLERWRWLPERRPERLVLVNTAGGRLEALRGEDVPLQMKVIVGALSTPTPLFHTRIEAVVLAPYWYVPPSIARAEVLPRASRDGGYLSRNGFERLSGGRLRQRPGPSNPLGGLKFVVPNPYGIGLHDTSAPHLFGRSTCTFSHGCIRLEKPIELALYTLDGDATWTRDAILSTIARWKETRVDLKDQIQLIVGYWSAWVEADGSVNFRPDPYGYDARLTRALAAEL